MCKKVVVSIQNGILAPKKERNSFTCNECMDLKCIMLNEVSQTEEIKYPRLILTCGI